MVTETGIYLILIKTGSCCKMLLMTQKQRWVQATLVEHCGYDQFDNRRIREPAGGPAYFHQYDDAHQGRVYGGSPGPTCLPVQARGLAVEDVAVDPRERTEREHDGVGAT